MGVRSTFSPSSVLSDILGALMPLASSAERNAELGEKLDDIHAETRKIRVGNEQYVYGEEVEDNEVEDD